MKPCTTVHAFSKDSRDDNCRNCSPGPGAYESDQINEFGKNAPKVSMYGRAQTVKVEINPGPGSYDYSTGLFSPAKT